MASDKESSDDYRWINFIVNDRHRIITATYPMDMDGKVQYGSMYVLQYRGGKNNWCGKKYFVTWQRASKVAKDMFNVVLPPSKTPILNPVAASLAGKSTLA